MAADPQLRGILGKLVRRTEGGGQHWSRADELGWGDSGLSDSFDTSVSQWKIRIASQDGDGQPPYELLLLDQKGRNLESLKTVSLARAMREDVGEMNDELAKLYKLAKRGALGVDSALDEIDRYLGE